jgi:hypothetical protein
MLFDQPRRSFDLVVMAAARAAPARMFLWEGLQPRCFSISRDEVPKRVQRC